VDADTVKALRKMVFQEGDVLAGATDQPRLLVRQRDRDFFDQYVYTTDGLDPLLALDHANLTDAPRNVASNARLFCDRLGQLGAAECHRLARYIHQRTYLVVVSTPEFDSAYKIFTVLNERGLDLTHADVFKANVLGSIPEGDLAKYTKLWEDEEEDLGRDGFADLFGQVRMIFDKSKARESILKEFRSVVLDKFPDGRVFIDKVLVPYSDAYELVTRASYVASENAEAVNTMLRWLNRLDNTDWVPPAIWFIRHRGSDAAAVVNFLIGLERLAASMFIRRVDVTRRVERYGRLLTTMEAGEDLYSLESPLRLSAEEKVDTLRSLDGDVYLTQRTRLYVLLRLEADLSDSGTFFSFPTISVEHVLPQNPSPGSKWLSTFDEETHRNWVHRLGNLLLLSTRKNSEASNLEFDDKKTKYFSLATGGSPFALTSTVLAQTEWTPDVLEKRQSQLLGRLQKVWDL
jgi:hypothetical protein